MNAINYKPYYERLRRRRDEVMTTRAHLEREQRVVDENQVWLDRAAYQSRVELLDSLADWYAQETVQIDDALARFAEGKFGICIACHGPIEKQRLDATPEAPFCAGCQQTREEVSHA